MWGSVVADNEDMKTHSTSRKTDMMVDYFDTTAGACDWTSLEDIQVIMATKHDNISNENFVT